MTDSRTPDVAPVQEASRGFDNFVTNRGGRLWRAAWYLTGDRHKAQDLVQTALAKAYGHYAGLDDDEQFEAYVRTTIYRTYLQWWRRRWNGEVPSGELPEQAVDQSLASNRLDLARALKELPKMQRAVLVLRFYEDRSVTEVAELLGISVGSVKTHSSRGCANLRRSTHLTEARQ